MSGMNRGGNRKNTPPYVERPIPGPTINGQAYLAETSIAQDLRETDRIKVVCARSQSLAARMPRAMTR